jgi:BlaI family transcriptional regulator, penicillinase repressor
MKNPRISESEWLVMSLVWERAPVAASEIVAALSKQTGWHSRTIRTLLDRLVKKKALKINAETRPGRYLPLVSMQAAIRQESRSFLQRVFGGEPAAMLLHLVGEARLSPKDIKKLKGLLSEKEK